jgi:hypothetical protein
MIDMGAYKLRQQWVFDAIVFISHRQLHQELDKRGCFCLSV